MMWDWLHFPWHLCNSDRKSSPLCPSFWLGHHPGVVAKGSGSHHDLLTAYFNRTSTSLLNKPYSFLCFQNSCNYNSKSEALNQVCYSGGIKQQLAYSRPAEDSCINICCWELCGQYAAVLLNPFHFVTTAKLRAGHYVLSKHTCMRWARTIIIIIKNFDITASIHERHGLLLPQTKTSHSLAQSQKHQTVNRRGTVLLPWRPAEKWSLLQTSLSLRRPKKSSMKQSVRATLLAERNYSICIKAKTNTPNTFFCCFN